MAKCDFSFLLFWTCRSFHIKLPKGIFSNFCFDSDPFLRMCYVAKGFFQMFISKIPRDLFALFCEITQGFFVNAARSENGPFLVEKIRLFMAKSVFWSFLFDLLLFFMQFGEGFFSNADFHFDLFFSTRKPTKGYLQMTISKVQFDLFCIFGEIARGFLYFL